MDQRDPQHVLSDTHRELVELLERYKKAAADYHGERAQGYLTREITFLALEVGGPDRVRQLADLWAQHYPAASEPKK